MDSRTGWTVCNLSTLKAYRSRGCGENQTVEGGREAGIEPPMTAWSYRRVKVELRFEID